MPFLKCYSSKSRVGLCILGFNHLKIISSSWLDIKKGSDFYKEGHCGTKMYNKIYIFEMVITI